MKMPSREWQNRIRQAQTGEGVLALVVEFLATLTPEEVASLPITSRPYSLREQSDVVAFTVQLARDELMFAGPPEVVALLREMVAVFSEAANRLSSLSIDILRPDK